VRLRYYLVVVGHGEFPCGSLEKANQHKRRFEELGAKCFVEVRT
jgi:hypothetical protein